MAVTGVGAICAVGHDAREFAAALARGADGIRPIAGFDTSCYSNHLGTEVVGFDPAAYAVILPGLERYDRAVQLALVAAHEALAGAGLLGPPAAPDEAGVVVATSLGGALALEEYVAQAAAAQRPDPELLIRLPQSTVAGALASHFGFSGECATIASACAAGTNAVGYAFDLIRYGHLRRVLVGGVDPFTRLSFSGFHALRSLSRDGCRPFSEDRDGLVIGEGASFCVLEDLEDARERRATLYAEVLGYGISNDCYHTTTPHPEGDGAVRSMLVGLEDAGIGPDDIDYVNAHGTATPANDPMEVKALERVFGGRARPLPVSSIKSMIGHGLGAAGSLEFAACLIALREGVMPPTLGCTKPIAGGWIDFLPRPRRAKIDTVMSSSFAFAGNTAVVVAGRPRET